MGSSRRSTRAVLERHSIGDTVVVLVVLADQLKGYSEFSEGVLVLESSSKTIAGTVPVLNNKIKWTEKTAILCAR